MRVNQSSANPAYDRHLGVFVRRSDASRLFLRLVRPLRRDEDDAIGATQAVDRGVRWILQDLDRLDIVRIEPNEGTMWSCLDRRIVDDIERRVAAERRAHAANLDRD